MPVPRDGNASGIYIGSDECAAAGRKWKGCMGGVEVALLTVVAAGNWARSGKYTELPNGSVTRAMAHASHMSHFAHGRARSR